MSWNKIERDCSCSNCDYALEKGRDVQVIQNRVYCEDCYESVFRGTPGYLPVYSC